MSVVISLLASFDTWLRINLVLLGMNIIWECAEPQLHLWLLRASLRFFIN